MTPTMIPDIWLPISEVWKVRCNYVSKVPLYTMRGKSSVEIGFLLQGIYFIERKNLKGSVTESEISQLVTSHHKLIKLSKR